MSFDALPIIVVSAHTQTAADEFVKELIEEDVTVEIRPGGAGAEQASADRVWRIRNRYYTCDVRVRARTAGDAPVAVPSSVDAHVLLLEEAEVRGEEEAMCGRLDERAWLGDWPADVRVVACRTRVLPARLQAECASRMLEPVALLDEEEGVYSVRAAMHAHVWPSMRRARPSRREPDSGSSSLGSDTEMQALGVEAMERFAAALGALGPAAEAVQGLQGAERRAAAEHLVAAFAAAVQHDVNL